MAVFSGLLVEEDPSLLSSRIHLLRDREREREREGKEEGGRATIDVPIQQVQERGEDAGHSTRISGNRATPPPPPPPSPPSRVEEAIRFAALLVEFHRVI